MRVFVCANVNNLSSSVLSYLSMMLVRVDVLFCNRLKCSTTNKTHWIQLLPATLTLVDLWATLNAVSSLMVATVPVAMTMGEEVH